MLRSALALYQGDQSSRGPFDATTLDTSVLHRLLEGGYLCHIPYDPGGGASSENYIVVRGEVFCLSHGSLDVTTAAGQLSPAAQLRAKGFGWEGKRPFVAYRGPASTHCTDWALWLESRGALVAFALLPVYLVLAVWPLGRWVVASQAVKTLLVVTGVGLGLGGWAAWAAWPGVPSAVAIVVALLVLVALALSTVRPGVLGGLGEGEPPSWVLENGKDRHELARALDGVIGAFRATLFLVLLPLLSLAAVRVVSMPSGYGFLADPFCECLATRLMLGAVAGLVTAIVFSLNVVASAARGGAPHRAVRCRPVLLYVVSSACVLVVASPYLTWLRHGIESQEVSALGPLVLMAAFLLMRTWTIAVLLRRFAGHLADENAARGLRGVSAHPSRPAEPGDATRLPPVV